jgi:hypothetical protein
MDIQIFKHAGNIPAMPLLDAHFGGFFVLEGVEERVADLGSMVEACLVRKNCLSLKPIKPAKAMLSGVPSNRRVTCFWGLK